MDELREAFNEAYDKAEQAEQDDNPELEQPEEITDDGEQKEPEEELAAETESKEIESDAEREDPQPQAAPEPVAAKPEKVPASWSATAKQTWDKVPADARKEILKRESEVNNVLQQSATARKAVETLNRTLEPYKPGLIASGAQSPFEVIDVLLRTEATLRSGTQQEKSRMIAGLIQQYGVDIPELDTVLSGQSAPKETNMFEQMLNEKLAPVNQFLSQQQMAAQQQQYELQNNAQQSISEFAETAEFLDNVRGDMADLLDMAASRGQELTLQQAYDKACAINPEISSILEARKQQQKIIGANQTAQQKKSAAASITGLQRGGGGKATNLSLHDTISQAWDSQFE